MLQEKGAPGEPHEGAVFEGCSRKPHSDQELRDGNDLTGYTGTVSSRLDMMVAIIN